MRTKLYFATKHISEAIAGVSTCPSKQEMLQWGSNIEALLQNRYGRILFHRFLKQEYCEECIEFYVEVEKFKKLRINRLPLRAKKIFEKYIKPGSMNEVNLDQDVRNNVKNSLEARITREIFDEAQKSIKQLLERDAYQRFLKSEAYSKCLSKDEKFSSTETLTESIHSNSKSSITLIQL